MGSFNGKSRDSLKETVRQKEINESGGTKKNSREFSLQMNSREGTSKEGTDVKNGNYKTRRAVL